MMERERVRCDVSVACQPPLSRDPACPRPALASSSPLLSSTSPCPSWPLERADLGLGVFSGTACLSVAAGRRLSHSLAGGVAPIVSLALHFPLTATFYLESHLCLVPARSVPPCVMTPLFLLVVLQALFLVSVTGEWSRLFFLHSLFVLTPDTSQLPTAVSSQATKPCYRCVCPPSSPRSRRFFYKPVSQARILCKWSKRYPSRRYPALLLLHFPFFLGPRRPCTARSHPPITTDTRLHSPGRSSKLPFGRWIRPHRPPSPRGRSCLFRACPRPTSSRVLLG
jgi:hypothetical protein